MSDNNLKQLFALSKSIFYLKALYAMSDKTSLEDLVKGSKKRGSDKLKEIMETMDDSSDEESDSGDNLLKRRGGDSFNLPALNELVDLPELAIFTVLVLASLFWVKDSKIASITGENFAPIGRAGITVVAYLLARFINKTDLLKKI